MKNDERFEKFKNYRSPLDRGELYLVFPLEMQKYERQFVETAINHYGGLLVTLCFTNFEGTEQVIKHIDLR